LPRLEANDIDQEIKESAITSMGLIVAHFADELGSELKSVFPILMGRLRNEITRMPTLKTLALIATSPLRIDLADILNNVVVELGQFLKQQSRSLKQTTLETLNALVASNGTHMSGDLFASMMTEASSLVHDTDLHLSHLALRLTVSVLSVSPSATITVRDKVLPKALVLAASPLLQGMALQTLLDLFRELVSLNATEAGLGFDALLQSLLEPVSRISSAEGLPKQSIANTARFVAVLCVYTDRAVCMKTVDKFTRDVQEAPSDEAKLLALLSLGETGRQLDMTSQPKLQSVILDAFETGSEETKAGAAYALGHLTVGNMGSYLPVLLKTLNSGKNEYLLLSALKEVITCHSTTAGLDFSPYVTDVIPILTKHCQSEEEGVRNMVAECLGQLAIIDPSVVIPLLADLCNGSSAGTHTRWTAITALKSCMTSDAALEQLSSCIGSFLAMLRDEELPVRRAALLTLNSTAHHQPQLVTNLLDSLVIPVLHETIQLKLERVVDLGPFKHKVDDGLPLRKAAFSCMDTFFDTMPDRISVPDFIPYLASGLKDKDDVQMLSHQVLMKIVQLQPGAVLGTLETLLEPIDKSIHRKVKDTQVGTEVERANDMIRSGLRVMEAMSHYQEIDADRKFQESMQKIHKKEKLANMILAIKAEQG